MRHRTRIRSALWLGALGVVIGACASASRVDPIPATTPMGSQFRESGIRRFIHRRDSEVLIEGWMNVLADTILVRSVPACDLDRPTIREPKRRVIVFRCSTVSLHFDARYPISRASITYWDFHPLTKRWSPVTQRLMITADTVQ